MGVLERFINGSENDAVSFPIADSADPLDWSGLIQTLGGTIAAGTASALIALPDGAEQAVSSLYDGSANFIEELVAAVFQPFVTAPLGLSGNGVPLDVIFGIFGYDSLVRGAAVRVWDIALIDKLGLFALPGAIVIVLASSYIVVQGGQKAIDVWQSGGGL